MVDRVFKRVGIFSTAIVLAATVLPMTVPVAQASAGHTLPANTRFYVPKPQPGAVAQAGDLADAGQLADARVLRKMISTPQAVWFTGGTPSQVKKDVRQVVHVANAQGTVPILVAYNIPYRDCSQYSAGGATSTAAYEAWIDGFAAGIGTGRAVVLVEPDGLGIIPWYKQFRGLPAEAADYEWCRPADANAATAADDRFTPLNYAVTALEARPNTVVYLDATHSSWLGAGDAAHRLSQAGVDKAQGFFLNVSNYELTSHLAKYGAWVSKCLWFASSTSGSWGAGHYDWCGSQYYPATASDFSTWGLTDQWYANNVENQTWVPYPGDAGLKHFVIDTSRNGQGPWTPAVSYPDPQVWCNPIDRGAGIQTTTKTGNDLIDAYLWVKIPGASDGQCNRGVSGSTTDPVWGGITDPPAGTWFPQMALQLAKNADPAFKR